MQVYRWEEMDQDHPMDLLGRRRIIGENVMISEITLEQGCCVPTHSHENEQMAIVVSGRIRFGIGAENSPERREVELTGGEVIHLPSNVPHSARAIERTVVLDVFSPTSEETGIDKH